VAIALDGGVPDFGADRPAGQSRLGIFKRQRDEPIPGSATITQDSDDGQAAGLAGMVPQQAAWTETIGAQAETDSSVSAADFDARLVKESFAAVAVNAALATEYFYSHLFIASPETRGMFPMGMSQMRDRLFAALARIVWSLDSPAESATYLSQLGRDHRKFGVQDKHYQEFFKALHDTVACLNGSSWTPEADAAWQGALAYAARTMRTAATTDARDNPPWWVGEVVRHDRRGDTVAVVTIRPDKPLPFRAGQYLTVQVPRWPRIWRAFSIANAPRTDGLIDLHVRAVPGGMVSNALVRHAVERDTVLLGPARGEMTLPDNDRDLLCVAGGTGLGPIKAIIESVAAGPAPGRARKITLFAGARRREDLYDLADLQRLQAVCSGLKVIPVLSAESVPSGETGVSGMLADVVEGHSLFDNCEAYVCGPEEMVAQVTLLLAAHLPAEQIHYDPPVEQARPAEPAGQAASPGPAPYLR
jgi:NAD(P)H-flavin reductase/hemoglobin-like flavoprotein